MNHMTTFEFQAKPGKAQALIVFFKQILPGTRTFTGNTGTELSRLSEDGFIIVTHWQDESNLGEYLEWREKKGDFSILLSFLSQAPNIVSYDVLQGI